MQKPSARRHHDDEHDTGINLSPVMSILVILIPTLLVVFNFFEVSTVAVAAPRIAPNSATNPTPADRLTVIARHDGVEVRLLPANGDDASVDRFALTDTAPLANRIAALKTAFRDLNTVHVGAEETLDWQQVARVIDSVDVFARVVFVLDDGH